MREDKVPITLRLDGKTHECLKLISQQEMRSLNTQIEYFLREEVKKYVTNPDIGDEIALIIDSGR